MTSKKINAMILQIITKLEFRDMNKWVIAYPNIYIYIYIFFFFKTSINGGRKFESWIF